MRTFCVEGTSKNLPSYQSYQISVALVQLDVTTSSYTSCIFNRWQTRQRMQKKTFVRVIICNLLKTPRTPKRPNKRPTSHFIAEVNSTYTAKRMKGNKEEGEYRMIQVITGPKRETKKPQESIAMARRYRQHLENVQRKRGGMTKSGQVYQTFWERHCTSLRAARSRRCSGLRTRTIADASDDEVCDGE